MKKLLLLSAFVLSSFFANAQVISFEASEGFTLGDINGQNGWTVTGAGPGVFVENQVISSEFATDGTYSLKIATEDAFPGQNSPVVGAFKQLETPISDAEYSFSFDINISELGGADFAFYALSEGLDGNGAQTFFFVNRVLFNFEALLTVLTLNDLDALVVETVDGFEWEANTWYNLRIEGNNTTGVINYYIDDVLVFEGETVRDTPITDIRFVNDNWGGFAYIDNFNVNEQTASVNDFFAQNISLYPNPVSDIFNLSSTTSTIENITLTDLNGRTVKNINVNSLSSTEVNISDLTSGMYFVTVQTDNGSGSTKIIKK